MDIDGDSTMVLAGIVLSLVAAAELYPLWRRTKGD
jgi:hypothetical protein